MFCNLKSTGREIHVIYHAPPARYVRVQTSSSHRVFSYPRVAIGHRSTTSPLPQSNRVTSEKTRHVSHRAFALNVFLECVSRVSEKLARVRSLILHMNGQKVSKFSPGKGPHQTRGAVDELFLRHTTPPPHIVVKPVSVPVLVNGSR